MTHRHLLPLATAIAASALATAIAPTALADTAPPVMDDLSYAQTGHGFVLQAAAHGDVAHVDITVHPTWVKGFASDITFSIAQPQADGIYRTTGPLDLAPGRYALSATATSADGTRSLEMTPEGDGLFFETQPVFHDTSLTPDELSFTSRTVAATGRLTTYDPNTGDTGTPWTGPVTLELDSGYASTTSTSPLGADGSFTVSFAPSPDNRTAETIKVKALIADPNTTGQDTIPGPAKSAPIAGFLPSRLVLDQTGTSQVTAGSPVTVSGTLQYQDDTGWHPISGALIYLDAPKGWSPYQAHTNDSGRFSVTMPAPSAPTVWPVTPLFTSAYTYVDGSQASFSITEVNQAIGLQLSAASVDALGNLTLHQTLTSSNGTYPAHVQLQQSADGRTGWTTITTLAATTATHTLHVSNPHGYWRLYSPATPGYAAATGNTVHTTRYLTQINGGTPNTTTAHHGQTLTFTGNLWEQNTTGWYRMTGWTVTLRFRPTGTTTWHTITTTRTNAGAWFTLHTTATQSGTWAVTFTTPDNNHTDTTGPTSYIHIS